MPQLEELAREEINFSCCGDGAFIICGKIQLYVAFYLEQHLSFNIRSLYIRFFICVDISHKIWLRQ
jgi:hypothetical protein